MTKRTTLAGIALSLIMLLCTACSAALPSATPTPEPQQTAEPTATLDAATTPEPTTLLIAAAASLENCYVTQLIPLFQKDNPTITISGTYDSSGKLQQQIEEGLEADIFMSAATKQMDALSSAALVDPATVVPLLVNEIVLIAPTASKTAIDSFEKIADADTIAIGDPASVPAGQYAQEALEQLNLWNAIQGKLSLATNVTEVLGQVAEGSADVGIVYATDAAQVPDRVKILAVAPEGSLKQRVIYPVGIVASTKRREAADRFVAFLQTPEARKIFEENGFKAAQ